MYQKKFDLNMDSKNARNLLAVLTRFLVLTLKSKFQYIKYSQCKVAIKGDENC